MKEKMIGIFVCVLLIVVSALSVSGTTNNIKNTGESHVNHSNFVELVLSGNCILSDWSEQKLIASDGAFDDAFGCCVSLDGGYAVIGAPHDDDNGDNSGSAYILKDNGMNWIEEQKLTASDGTASDLFGYYVSISGNYAIIGAPYDDDNGEMSGSAYIFKNTGSHWVEEQKLIASDGAASDLFGFVSLSGDYAIIGAPYDDDMGSNSGSAYIFRNYDTSWIEEQKLLASDATNFIGFGVTVSINEENAIIGAPYDDEMGYNSGSVYLFKNSGTSWIEEQKLTASDGAAEDCFGRCVSMDGDHAIIGVPNDDDYGENSGSAYIFKKIGASWKEEQKLTASDGAADDCFGHCVSIDNNYAIIGAENDDDNGEDSGSAYIFKHDGIRWTKDSKLLASDGVADDYFGESVSIYGNHSIVGVGLDDNSNGVDAGSVYIYGRFNRPPNKPVIKGSNSGKVGVEYCWTFKSNGPDGDKVMYFIEWDDGTMNETECVESYTPFSMCHTYSVEAIFIIRAKAKECTPDGLESDWSELKIKISKPRNVVSYSSSLLRFLESFPILQKILQCLLL